MSTDLLHRPPQLLHAASVLICQTSGKCCECSGEHAHSMRALCIAEYVKGGFRNRSMLADRAVGSVPNVKPPFGR
jgi:hypothetical protein